MQKQLLRSNVIDVSIEQHIARHSKTSHVIYVTVVLVLFAAGAILPFIRVDVSIHTDGIIRPVTEKHQVTVPISGFVQSVRVNENQRVEKGQVLLTVRDSQMQLSIAIIHKEIKQTRRLMKDLELLLRDGPPYVESIPFLVESLYGS